MAEATPLRVLFLTHSYPRVAGDAAGSFLLHLAVALRAHGVEVRVVAPGGHVPPGHGPAGTMLPATERLEGVQVERFHYAPRRFQTLAYTGEMAQEVRRSWSAKAALLGFLGAGLTATSRVAREFAPHVVHAHWWFPAGLLACSSMVRGGAPLVTTLHGTDVRLARATRLARPLFRRVVRRSHAVTTVSRWLASEVRAMAPGLTPLVAPMPVSTSLFHPGPDRSPGRSTDRLLFVGRLNAQKGVALLLDAVARLRSPMALDIVGDGPDRARLREQAEQLGIADRVSWHGAKGQPELPSFYRRATAVVVPSLGEGLGLVAVEAQLCEAPVVAFDSGGIADTIVHGETGLLAAPGDVDALAAALDRLSDDPELRLGLGRAGRIAALGDFSPESVSQRYATLYRSLLAT